MTMNANRAPLVTVIVPTYNGARTLKYTLQSLLNQSIEDFEAWVIGDASTDGSEELIISFNDTRLNWYNRPVNSGSQPAPNNEGLRRAKGKYIAYLGHDDLWFPDHLDNLVAHAKSENLDFLVSTIAYKNPLNYSVAGAEPKGIVGAFYRTTPTSWLHKKTMPEKIGFWNEDYLNSPIGPDVEYFRRLYDGAEKFLAVPKLTVLKFGSTAWKTYSLETKVIDEIKDAWNRIKSDPEKYQIEILNTLAHQYAQDSGDQIALSPYRAIKLMLRFIYLHFKKRFMNHAFFRPLFVSIYVWRRKSVDNLRGI